MGIYSTNRLSSTKSSAMRPDISYRGSAAVARCMYESTLNDITLGESLLMQDFQEARAIREGTVMRSELCSIHEASLEGFFKKAKEMLKKLGEKIMGIFRTVYAKLTQWFVRYGKAYVAMHRKTVMNKNIKNLTIKKYRKPKSDFKLESLSAGIEPRIKKIADQISSKKLGMDNTSEENDFKQHVVERILGTDKTSSSEYTEYIMNLAFEEEDDIDGSKFNSSMLTRLLDTVEEGRKPIRDLKKTEEKLVKAIKKVQGDLDKFEKELKKVDEDKRSNSEKSNASLIDRVRAYLTAVQTAVNTITAGSIKVVKFDIKQCRSAIAQIVAYSPKLHENNLYLIEAAEDAEDEFDEEMESPAEVDVADGYEDFDEDED